MIMKSLLVALLLACAPALAQTPGTSSNPTSQPVAYLGANYEPPCAPATTTGTITLALGTACANPVVSANGGSPDNWQFTLSGNGTIATTGPYKPGQVFTVKIIEGPSTPFTLVAPAGWSVGGLCTGNAVPISYCTLANQFPLSGSANGKNIFTCQVIDATPTIWCPSVSAGLTPVSSGFAFVNASQCGSVDGTTLCTTPAVSMSGANLFVVAVSFYNGAGATITSPSDSSSNSYTQAGSTATNGNTILQCYYDFNPTTSASQTFSATGTGSSNFAGISVAGFSGSAATPLDQTSTSVSSGNVTSLATTSITPTVANELVVGCLGLSAGTGSTSSVSVNGGFTLKAVENGTSGTTLGSALAYLIQTTATPAAETFSWADSAAADTVNLSFK